MVRFLKKVYQFYKTKTGKRTFFFAFYLIFFIVVGSFIVSIRDDKIDNDGQNSNQIVIFDKNSNYYEYQVIENEKVFNFSGYFNEKNSLLETFPNKYFLDYFNINQIIKHAKYLSKTEYNDKKYALNYEIMTEDLGLLVNKEQGNIEDTSNTITIIMDESIYLKTIELDISNYMNSMDNSINNYTISLNYMVKELEDKNE